MSSGNILDELIMLMGSSGPPANVMCVNPTGTGAKTLGSWAAGWTTIDSARADWSAGREIWVKYGNYGAMTGAFPANCIVRGGFAGTESLASQANPFLYSSMITAGQVWTHGVQLGAGVVWDGMRIACNNKYYGVIYSAGANNITISRCYAEGTAGGNGTIVVALSGTGNVVTDSTFLGTSSIVGTASRCRFRIVNSTDTATVITGQDNVYDRFRLDYTGTQTNCTILSYLAVYGYGYTQAYRNCIIVPVVTQGQMGGVQFYRCRLNSAEPLNGTDSCSKGDAGLLSVLNYRLATGSACIDAGNPAYVTSTTDFDGLPRTVTTVDIGACEYQSAPVAGPSNVTYVDLLSTGRGDGSNWANAFVLMSLAVGVVKGMAASAVDTIWMKGGQTHSITARIMVQKTSGGAFNVIGGFVGTETLESQRPTNGYTSIQQGASTNVWSLDNRDGSVPASCRLEGMSYSSIATSVSTIWWYAGPSIFSVAKSRFTGAIAASQGAIATTGATLNTFTVTDCIFTDMTGSGNGRTIVCSASMGAMIVNRCQFINITSSSGPAFYCGDYANTATIANCLFKNCQNTTGIGGTLMLWNQTFKNCTFTDCYSQNGKGNIVADRGGTNFLNCIINNNMPGAAAYGNTPVYTNTHRSWVEGDPLFVSATDFHLQAGSPCVETGTNANTFGLFDLDLNERIITTNVDKGCYECGTYTPPALDPVISSGLLAWYPFTKAKDALDHSGNGWHGTVYSGPYIDSYGLVLDGVDDYIKIANGALFMSLAGQIANGTTCMIWTRLPWSTLGTNGMMGAQQLDSAQLTGNACNIDVFHGGVSDGASASCTDTGAKTALTYPTINTRWADNAWRHFACVVNVVSSRVEIYHNGAMIVSTAITPASLYAAAYFAFIGKTSYSSGWAYGKGTVDDARFYNRQLSAAEVLQLYNATLADHGA